MRPSEVAHTCNSTIQKDEAGGLLGVCSHPGLQSIRTKQRTNNTVMCRDLIPSLQPSS